MLNQFVSLLVLIIFCGPLSALAAVDFSKLNNHSFYGAYVGANKVGYLEEKFETLEKDGKKAIVYRFNFYFEMGIFEEQEIGVFELSATYEFDFFSRELQHYYEKSKDIKYNRKEAVKLLLDSKKLSIFK